MKDTKMYETEETPEWKYRNMTLMFGAISLVLLALLIAFKIFN